MLGWYGIQDVRWQKPLHAYHASPGDRHMAFRLGRSLALPTYGFIRIRVTNMWHRRVSGSQQRPAIHPVKTSSTTEPSSATLIGRPILLMYSWSASIPRA